MSFLKNSSIYLGAEIINKSIPFLLLPIFTQYLTPSDYGIIASFNSFVAFTSIFIGLSVQGAINVNFFKYTKDKLKIYIVNAILLLVITTIIVFFIVFTFETQISEKLYLDNQWLYIGVIIAFAQFISLLNLTLWIAEKRPKEYSLYQISQTIVTAMITLSLVVAYNLGWTGQLISIIITSLSFSLLSLYLLFKREYFTFKYEKESMNDLLKFGIPLIPHTLSGWIITSGDKILLLIMVGASATGLFTIGYQISMIMGVLVTSFHKVWNPYIYEKLSLKEIDIKIKIKIVKFTYLYFILIIILVFFLNEMAKYIFLVLLAKEYTDSYKFVIYILISFGFNGMYFMVVSYIFFMHKTKELAKITFSSAILHIILSYTFISLYGSIGVAYSGIMSYFIMFILVWRLSHKVYPMPWLFWRY